VVHRHFINDGHQLAQQINTTIKLAAVYAAVSGGANVDDVIAQGIKSGQYQLNNLSMCCFAEAVLTCCLTLWNFTCQLRASKAFHIKKNWPSKCYR
jgi:hypothetical protein